MHRQQNMNFLNALFVLTRQISLYPGGTGFESMPVHVLLWPRSSWTFIALPREHYTKSEQECLLAFQNVPNNLFISLKIK